MSTRVPKTKVAGLTGWMLKKFATKKFGAVPEPAEVYWHSPKVPKAMFGLGRKTEKWTALDADLKSYAHMAVATVVGCTWCLDMGYFLAYNDGLDAAKASQVPRWRESDVFTPLERDVLEYAEATSQTPPRVTDELAARLLEQLGPAAMVELTALVAIANMYTRSNTALGIESQEFSKDCPLPLAAPATGDRAAARPLASAS